MTQQLVVQIFREALMMTFWISLPVLIIAFLVGVVISLLQILTSMQDSAVATIPRLAAFLVALFLFLPWMLLRMSTYAVSIFSDFSRYAR